MIKFIKRISFVIWGVGGGGGQARQCAFLMRQTRNWISGEMFGEGSLVLIYLVMDRAKEGAAVA